MSIASRMPASTFRRRSLTSARSVPIADIRACSTCGFWSASWIFAPTRLALPLTRCVCATTSFPKEFPYTTPNGCVYDSGNYPKMLQVAKGLIGWDEWKKKQAAARTEGRLIGIGIGTTLDSGTNNFGQSQIVNPFLPYSGNSQGANCKLDIYGEVVVAVGSCPQGQGHETTAAQVVGDVLNIHPDLITVRTGFDTERNVHTGFSGTYASQFAVSGLSAVHGAAQKLKAEMQRLAAFALNTKEERPRVRDGRARPGNPCDEHRQVDELLGAGQPGQCQQRQLAA